MGKTQIPQIIEIIRPLIEKWMSEKRVGSITINFFKGGVSTIKIGQEETIKLD